MHWGRSEVKGGAERGGVVWHGGIKVVEHVRTREGRIELLGSETGVFCRPESEGKVGAETVRGTGKEEDEEGTELFRGLVKVVRRDLGEGRVGRAEEIDERRADVGHLRLEQRVRVDPLRGRERRGARRGRLGRCERACRMVARMSCGQENPRRCSRPHRRHIPRAFFSRGCKVYKTSNTPIDESSSSWLSRLHKHENKSVTLAKIQKL